MRRAAEALGRAGVTVTRIELPADFDRIEWITYTLLCRGIAWHHGGDYDRAAASMSPRMRELVERGRSIGDAEQAGGLPIGAQLAAGPGEEALLLAAARLIRENL
ncbi:MAG: hypothetical protein ACOZDY_06425 [Pseudomonadota bacterium]